MNSEKERWTLQQRRQALDAFFTSEDGNRFLAIFTHDCDENDRAVFLSDAERRFRSDDEDAGHWWKSLQNLVKSEQHLALAEPLTQNDVTIEEFYECLPDDFDPQALVQAIRISRSPITYNGLPPGISNIAGWSEEQIRKQSEEVKAKLDWENTKGSARKWWEEFERENNHRLGLILRLAEELANRTATITEFFLAYVYSDTENIQANLHYLDYDRLKKRGGRDKKLKQETETEDVTKEHVELSANNSNWWLESKPGVTKVRGWTNERILGQLEKMKAELEWESTTGSARKWWDAFEKENQHRLAIVLRLAEELVNRKATITEFFLAYVYSNTEDLQANLHYLDYTRLKKEEKKRNELKALEKNDLVNK